MLETLRLMDFRCFPQAALTLPADGGVFLGDNAQGKTSLLEAACLLMRLQSPRTMKVGELVREGAMHFGLAGETEDAVFRLESKGTTLQSTIDGEVVGRRADYIARSELIVWMGTSDLQLVRGGGGDRRRYLDFLAAQIDPDYRRHWSRYRKVLQIRNRALKEQAAVAEIRAYRDLLINHGLELQERRQQVCLDLAPQVAHCHRDISGKDEEVALTYAPQEKEDLAAAFDRVEENERRRGMTLVGPHRDEVTLMLNGRAARAYGSEGQQRTLALALKLAQGEVLRRLGGKAPIYLIDDVFGELDRSRRHAVLAQLPKESQKLITTTSLEWLDDHHEDQWQPTTLWRVADQQVAPK